MLGQKILRSRLRGEVARFMGTNSRVGADVELECMYVLYDYVYLRNTLNRVYKANLIENRAQA